MDTTIPLIGLGLLVIIGNLLKRLFVVRKIPDIIILICIGLLIGPIGGLLSPDDFGILGPIFSMMTLVIILFEGGVGLHIQEIIGSLRHATILSICTFFATSILSAGLFMAIMGVDQMVALVYGCMVGGLSPAVVVPLSRHLGVNETTRTMLTLESALADVLCIVAVISLLNIFQTQTVTVIGAVSQLGSMFFVAIGTGLIAGLSWAAFRDRIRRIESIFTVPAFVCVLYGFTELIDGSGAISVLVFGIVLGNICLLQQVSIPGLDFTPACNLSDKEVEVFTQLADLVKTFFFIYIGISLTFTSPLILALALIVLLAIHLIRIPIVIATVSPEIPRFDRWVTSVMIPKGLATAVLVSQPIQYGLVDAEILEPVIYPVIIFSVASSAVLAYILEKKFESDIQCCKL